MAKKRRAYIDNNFNDFPNAEDKEIKNKPFWALLAATFLVSIIVIIGIVDSTIHLTSNAVINIAWMGAGNEFHFEVRGIDGIYNATVQILEDVKNGKIIIENDETIPFAGDYYTKFRVYSADEGKFGTINFIFKLKQTKIREEGMIAEDIKLYVDSREIPLTIAKKDGTYVYYSVNTGEMGNYVIGVRKNIQENGDETGDDAGKSISEDFEDIEGDTRVGDTKTSKTIADEEPVEELVEEPDTQQPAIIEKAAEGITIEKESFFKKLKKMLFGWF